MKSKIFECLKWSLITPLYMAPISLSDTLWQKVKGTIFTFSLSHAYYYYREKPKYCLFGSVVYSWPNPCSKTLPEFNRWILLPAKLIHSFQWKVYKAILSEFPKYAYIISMQQFLVFLANCCWGFHGNQFHSLKRLLELSDSHENTDTCFIGVSE